MRGYIYGAKYHIEEFVRGKWQPAPFLPLEGCVVVNRRGEVYEKNIDTTVGILMNGRKRGTKYHFKDECVYKKQSHPRWRVKEVEIIKDRYHGRTVYELE